MNVLCKNTAGVSERMNILVDHPYPGTYANLVMLKSEYREQDPEEAERFKPWFKRVQFSRRFLERELFIHGSLLCVYCGKDNLVIEYEGGTVAKKQLATVDHFNPVSRGGTNNRKNLKVSCSICNTNKGDRIYSSDKLKYERKPRWFMLLAAYVKFNIFKKYKS